MNVNWQRAALNIRQSGMPLTRASQKIGRHKNWLNQLANGFLIEPYWSDAVALLNLHEQLCGPDKTRELLQ